MSYHIYTTDGIILRRQAIGEANLLLSVLTRDLGLIFASAQAVRAQASKLRPAVQEFAHVTLSCVKGKSGWKATSAASTGSFYFDTPAQAHRVLAQMASVIQKLMPGEEPHPEVFDAVLSAFSFLPSVSEADIPDFECLLMLRLLYLLGYVEKDAGTEIFLSDTAMWNETLLREVAQDHLALVAVVNKGLAASNLA
jgi:DNA repair protein RecO